MRELVRMWLAQGSGVAQHAGFSNASQISTYQRELEMASKKKHELGDVGALLTRTSDRSQLRLGSKRGMSWANPPECGMCTYVCMVR